MSVRETALRVKAAAAAVAQRSDMDGVLYAIAAEIREDSRKILDANALDIADFDAAGGGALRDRLLLTAARVEDMAAGIEQVAALPSPVGAGTVATRPNGLRIEKIRVPLGAIGVIYEARPNVTSDVAALCLKSGNAVLLRGGKRAFRSNGAITAAIRKTLRGKGLPEDAVCMVEDSSRESSVEMMGLRGVLDLLIPRGGAELIRTVVENSKVPVIETGVGNCHVYFDADSDEKMALDIIDNAKRSRPSVCNAAETLVVHSAIAESVLPQVKARLFDVQLRGCEKTRAIIDCAPATDEDFFTEYGDKILSVKTVDGLGEAIDFINAHSSGHSECIVTNNYPNAEEFTRKINSAAVYVNASTRFTDGGEFGLGAEVGISTSKLHARGPMGLHALTTDKFVIYGAGQIRG